MRVGAPARLLHRPCACSMGGGGGREREPQVPCIGEHGREKRGGRCCILSWSISDYGFEQFETRSSVASSARLEETNNAGSYGVCRLPPHGVLCFTSPSPPPSLTALYAPAGSLRCGAKTGTGPLYTRLQLSIACKGLANLDKLSKSDPFVVRNNRRRSS